MTPMKPLCFVLMPFGTKSTVSGMSIDFDRVYADLIGPAIEAAEMEPIRADEEQAGGIIHRPMYERLILCEYALADLTTANANVFYELGVRHAARPRSTVMLFADGSGQLPFDVGLLRALPYRLGRDGAPCAVEAGVASIVERLQAARGPARDSPLYQLVDDYPDVQHEKTDVFRQRVDYRTAMKARLAAARRGGADAVRSVLDDLGDVGNSEAGVVIDLFLSFRAVKAWEEMIALVDRMAEPLRRTVMVQEQLALALNRAGRDDEAERVVKRLLDERGPSSETYGILGRVYKDRWEAAQNAGQKALARGLLKRAIEAYVAGFETDWRDPYPGVNAVTLMELASGNGADELRAQQAELLPVVSYAVERRIAAGAPDYWDYATQLELAVLRRDDDKAFEVLADAVSAVRETWEPETTCRNLRLIREARAGRGESVQTLLAIEEELLASAE